MTRIQQKPALSRAIGDPESIATLQAEADALREALAKAEARIGQCPWRPIETLGFGVEQHIVIATEYGFAWVVECDKDMDGEWLKRSYAKDAEHTGPVTHWRLLDLPQPAHLSKPGGE